MEEFGLVFTGSRWGYIKNTHFASLLGVPITRMYNCCQQGSSSGWIEYAALELPYPPSAKALQDEPCHMGSLNTRGAEEDSIIQGP